MIDDDFDKLVRNMFERFFGNSFRLIPGENGIQMRVDSEDGLNKGRELTVDKVDLGEEYLVIVESPIHVDSIIAAIKNNKLEININENVNQGIEVEIPFDVDIKKSNVSIKNGVVEARLVKAQDGMTIEREGILTVIM